MSAQSSRREFLEVAGTAVAGAWVSLQTPLAAEDCPAQSASTAKSSQQKEKPVDQRDLSIVDTHQHLWDLDKLQLPWLKGDAVQKINRSFLMSDYLTAIGSHKVVKTVYMEVNVTPSQQRAEAEYVLGLCRRPDNPMIGAIIGGSPQSAEFRKYIEPYSSNGRVNGVRTVLHDPDRPRGLCLEKTFVENVQLLGEIDKSFDLCMRPGEFLDAVKLAEQCPKTRLVVDHCGNMPVQSDDKQLREAWMKGLREMAQRPNTFCKISGIIVTAKPGAWKPQDLAANVNFCLETFGIERCFFGGDWPVCTLTAPLLEWIDALKLIVKDKPLDFQKKLFHDNAVRIYKLLEKNAV